VQCLNETSDPPLSSLCPDGHEVGEKEEVYSAWRYWG